MNGQKALIYPKYAERALLEREKISKWGAANETEIEALKVKNTYVKTIALLNVDSPAVDWVTQVGADTHGFFNLPSLLAAMELQHQKMYIDTLADTIEGADLLRDFTSIVWSCSRKSRISGWLASGKAGCSLDDSLYFPYLAIPVILY